jgi:hypothetical protein
VISYLNDKPDLEEFSPLDAYRAFQFFELNQPKISEWTERMMNRKPQILGFIYPLQPYLREFEGE